MQTVVISTLTTAVDLATALQLKVDGILENQRVPTVLFSAPSHFMQIKKEISECLELR